MVKQVIMEHIPRTLFGVKYNMKISSQVTIMNMITMCNTKNEQDKLVVTLSKKPEIYSEVKPIKWSLKAE
jgi:hypothetical protein